MLHVDNLYLTPKKTTPPPPPPAFDIHTKNDANK